MSIKSFTAPGVAPSVERCRQTPGNGNWLLRLLKQHFELRRRKRRREEGLAAIRKLPRHLQADVGFELKTNIDE